MKYKIELNYVTKEFINEYPFNRYPELMYKKSRPYNCLLIDCHPDYFICIPFRSNINHTNSYLFKKSERSKKTKSGLDYSKMLIIRDKAFLDSKGVVVDQDEYQEMIVNINKIVHDACGYLDKYIRHIKGIRILDIREFNRLYKFSTLKYFHDILKI